jgi:peptidoglycan/xylan/chitin deacetylase (PgdA/CDA1 family)
VTEPGTLPPTSSASGLLPPARYIAHGSRSEPRVALTFHASGDPLLAQRLLDVLAVHQTPVTVFGVGQWLAAHPDLVGRIRRDGHELANHTLSHQAMGQMSATTIAREITGCAEVLRRLTGSISSWFRPSGIDVPTGVILVEAGRAGYPVSVGYDVDSLDFRDPGVVAIETTVRNGMQAGSIVSLHFGHRGTIEAIGSIIDHAHASGWEPVTVSRLLA